MKDTLGEKSAKPEGLLLSYMCLEVSVGEFLNLLVAWAKVQDSWTTKNSSWVPRNLIRDLW